MAHDDDENYDLCYNVNYVTDFFGAIYREEIKTKFTRSIDEIFEISNSKTKYLMCGLPPYKILDQFLLNQRPDLNDRIWTLLYNQIKNQKDDYITISYDFNALCYSNINGAAAILLWYIKTIILNEKGSVTVNDKNGNKVEISVCGDINFQGKKLLGINISHKNVHMGLGAFTLEELPEIVVQNIPGKNFNQIIGESNFPDFKIKDAYTSGNSTILEYPDVQENILDLIKSQNPHLVL